MASLPYLQKVTGKESKEPAMLAYMGASRHALEKYVLQEIGRVKLARCGMPAPRIVRQPTQLCKLYVVMRAS